MVSLENVKVLIVEDDEKIAELIQNAMKDVGCEVEIAYNGEEALEKVKNFLPDVIILDLLLPKIDGYTVFRRIRDDERTKDIPVLILTAKGDESDRVMGLDMGADDYIVKPFSPRELVSRVRAVLRRYRKGLRMEPEKIVVGDIEIDPAGYRVRVRGKKVDLTPKEFELLKFLAENAGKVMDRETLLEKIWGTTGGESRTIDVHIRRLRQKIEEDPTNPKYIKTVYGVGYKLEPGDE